jgi:alkanesulfonate monooxygenase SsuD/methylene tetrahydromethanopterin reductase-like flavin-dependent oxidoreductase (luciferase family)
MKFGLFCTYENPREDCASAFADQTALVELIEQLGFDEVWVAEHHFNPNATSPAVFPILGYLAARTSRIRLGTATVLLPFHDPIIVAEQAATVDILSGGRLNLGVAKGGPFAAHYKHFHLDLEDARPKTDEALQLIRRLLHDDRVSFTGRFFNADSVSLVPRPVQRPVPLFVGTTTAEMIEAVARNGHGIMAGVVFPVDGIRDTLQRYRQAAPAGDPRLVLLRFFHLAPTREQAIGEARVMLKPFVERMQGTTAQLQPGWTPWMVLDRIIEDSLIGTAADVCGKIKWLRHELDPHSLALKPLSPLLDKRMQDLRVFAERVARC